MRVNLVRGLGAVLCAFCLSAPILAKSVSVDFGPVFGPGGDGDDFGTATLGDGSGACVSTFTGPESCPLTLINDASTDAIALGFPIDFGNGPVSNIFINENGIVSFSSPLTISSGSFASLTGLGQPVIAPYFGDLTSVTFTGTVFEMAGSNFGEIMYQRGSASAQVGADGNFDQADEVPAFAVLWYGPTDANGTQIFTQLIIYSHAASASGDFDIRIRYGLNTGDQYNISAAPTAIAGLQLGSNSLNIASPLLESTDYFYSFRGGKLVGSAPPPVTLACPIATAQAGKAYASSLSASGGVPPYTYGSSGTLPPGLALNASTGALSGTPTTAGTYSFTGKVTDSSGTAAGSVSQSCTITVAPAPASLTVSPGAVSFGTVSRYALELRGVTLTNNGSAAVSLSRVSVTPGSGASHLTFTPLSLCGSKLAAGKSCVIGVLLFADEVGTLSASLNIPNSASGSPQAVPLSVIVSKAH
jgi:Putative Ig domain